jgi:hypothetical protein
MGGWGKPIVKKSKLRIKKKSYQDFDIDILIRLQQEELSNLCFEK